MKKNKLKTKKEIHIDYLTGRKLDAGRKLLLHVSRKTIILCNRVLRKEDSKIEFVDRTLNNTLGNLTQV